jgi:hypothetical protein
MKKRFSAKNYPDMPNTVSELASGSSLFSGKRHSLKEV